MMIENKIRGKCPEAEMLKDTHWWRAWTRRTRRTCKEAVTQILNWDTVNQIKRGNFEI